jgi:hypothetical protein
MPVVTAFMSVFGLSINLISLYENSGKVKILCVSNILLSLHMNTSAALKQVSAKADFCEIKFKTLYKIYSFFQYSYLHCE